MATLPTNFKDDILDTSVNARRRYRVYENTDGTIELEDVTEYSQVGDEFGAGQINATNTEVNKKFDKNMLVRDLDTINAITKEGYAPDALALKEVNQSLEDNLQWKLVDSVTGTSQIDIPSDAKEIYVEVTRGDSTEVMYDFYLPIISLTNTEKAFARYYQTGSSVYHSGAIKATNKYVYIHRVLNGSNTSIASESTITLYYR